MSRAVLTLLAGAAISAITLAASPALAQQGEAAREDTPRSERPATEGADRAQPHDRRTEGRQPQDHRLQPIRKLNDFQLASWVLIDNDAQLRISQYAASVAKDRQIEQFAQRMIQAHRELSDRLHQPLRDKLAEHRPEAVADTEEFDVGGVLEEIGRQLEAAQPETVRPRPSNDRGVRSGTSNGRPEDDREREGAREEAQLNCQREQLGEARDQLDRRRDERSIAEDGRDDARDVESVIKELEESRGEQFGQSYLGFQVAMHIQRINSTEVARQQASPDLARVLSDGIEMSKGHLESARRRMHELKPDA